MENITNLGIFNSGEPMCKTSKDLCLDIGLMQVGPVLTTVQRYLIFLFAFYLVLTEDLNTDTSAPCAI
jgi:hypothetical protein